MLACGSSSAVAVSDFSRGGGRTQMPRTEQRGGPLGVDEAWTPSVVVGGTSGLILVGAALVGVTACGESGDKTTTSSGGAPNEGGESKVSDHYRDLTLCVAELRQYAGRR